jgi:hypothetical protein
MFVGMEDLHKSCLQIVMNEEGKELENSRINNNLKQVGRFFDENINDEKISVVMESSSVWYNIYSYLSALLSLQRKVTILVTYVGYTFPRNCK